MAQVNILPDRYFGLIKDDRCRYCVALPDNLVARGGHKVVFAMDLFDTGVFPPSVFVLILYEKKSEIFVFISLTQFDPHRDSFTN